MNSSHWPFVLLASFLVTLPCHGGAVAGDVIIIDGDTLKINETTYRLWGIDAPERGQQCEHKGEYYDCGAYARLALTAFIGDALPNCKTQYRDRYARSVARCSIEGTDIGDWLVHGGFAVDYPTYSKGYYRAVQDQAEDALRGIWQGDFTLPWEWRRGFGKKKGQAMPDPFSLEQPSARNE